MKKFILSFLICSIICLNSSIFYAYTLETVKNEETNENKVEGTNAKSDDSNEINKDDNKEANNTASNLNSESENNESKDKSDKAESGKLKDKSDKAESGKLKDKSEKDEPSESKDKSEKAESTNKEPSKLNKDSEGNNKSDNNNTTSTEANKKESDSSTETNIVKEQANTLVLNVKKNKQEKELNTKKAKKATEEKKLETANAELKSAEESKEKKEAEQKIEEAKKNIADTEKDIADTEIELKKTENEINIASIKNATNKISSENSKIYQYYAIGIVVVILIILIIILLVLIKKLSKNKFPKTLIGKFYVSVSNVHEIGARSEQQDSFVISSMDSKICKEKGLLAVVADGMGGLSNGKAISSLSADTMLNCFNAMKKGFESSDALFNMLVTVNDTVNDYMSYNGLNNSGSTLVSTYINNNILYWLSVGDSSIVVIRNGKILQLNAFHNYGAELDEKAARGEISFEDAYNDDQRDALTSYIGKGQINEIDRNIEGFRLKTGDKILLMTDGVTNSIGNDELLALVSDNPFEFGNNLKTAVLRKRKPNQDNFTAVIIDIK